MHFDKMCVGLVEILNTFIYLLTLFNSTVYIQKRAQRIIFSLISISSLPIYTRRTTREIRILQNRHKLHDLANVLLCLFYKFT